MQMYTILQIWKKRRGLNFSTYAHVHVSTSKCVHVSIQKFTPKSPARSHHREHHKKKTCDEKHPHMYKNIDIGKKTPRHSNTTHRHTSTPHLHQHPHPHPHIPPLSIRFPRSVSPHSCTHTHTTPHPLHAHTNTGYNEDITLCIRTERQIQLSCVDRWAVISQFVLLLKWESSKLLHM